MPGVTCPGLPASWLNGWLAAVGATVLDDRLRLHWTADSTPVAVLSAADADPVEAIVASWPDKALLADLPIAENWNDVGVLRRRVAVEEFAARARAARGHGYVWTLSSTMTDLHVDERGEVAHAPFDPPAPRHVQLCHPAWRRSMSNPSIEHIAKSLAGHAVRVKDNGLGFDQTRLGSQSDTTDMWVESVVEILAFFGLALLPVRGEGIDRRQGRFFGVRENQKGWLKTTTGKRRERRFMWPAWRQPLDSAGIDALMDLWSPSRKAAWSGIGVHAGWQTVRFIRRGSADVTTAFGAEQL